MGQSLKRALFSALLVILVSHPILGLELCTVGIKLEVPDVGARTLWTTAATVLAVLAWQLFRDRVSSKLGRGVGYKVDGSDLKNFLGLSSTRHWTILTLVVVVFVWPFLASCETVNIITLILIHVVPGIGLNIVVGLASLLDPGYVGLYTVGAYTYAPLVKYTGFGFQTALPIARMMAALFDFLLGFPVLYLRGDYLAIVTLGFDEITHILLCNVTEIVDGPNGIDSIPKPTLFGLTFEHHAPGGMQTLHKSFGIIYNTNYRVILLYAVALLLVLLTLFVINRLMCMPAGRAWEALHEDKVARRVLGLNPTIVKLSAFTIGTSFAGFAGSSFTAHQGLVTPEPSAFTESAMALAIAMFGGIGSQPGVILAAAVMVSFQGMRGFNEYRMPIFGLTMIIMTI